MKKILLAGPGTGKTTKVKKEFLSTVIDFDSVLVLSFTNATIGDLLKAFAKDGIPIGEKNCLTLHSYALRINHKKSLHILNTLEERIVSKYASLFGIEKKTLCEMLSCITYDQMITDFLEFAKTNPVYLKDQIGSIELLIVDEFQDFNEPEQQLVHLIAEHAAEVLILGDDDQCIYDFKDATSEGIVNLYNDPLVENIEHANVCYRCPDVIIEKCKNLLANNKERIKKDWHPNSKPGEIIFQQIKTLQETQDWLTKEIQSIRASEPDASILVLAPVQLAIEGLPEALESAGIPALNFFAESVDVELYKKIWFLRILYCRHKLLNLILLLECSGLSD